MLNDLWHDIYEMGDDCRNTEISNYQKLKKKLYFI